MRITAYTYPWDIARLGVEDSLRRMADDGIAAVDLAASYHPIDAISPRKGLHYFSSARGAVYFPARMSRYSRIKPMLHSPEICAAWPEAARHAPKLGLGLNAWTVTLFQPWIRDAYPECARVLPTGDANGSDVCAANEDVQAYIAALTEDAADQFGVGLVRLEGVVPHMYDLDWLRPRVLVDVPPLARTLLNLCFCGACMRRADAAGLDVERLRCVVMDNIEAEIRDGRSEAGVDRVAKLASNAELRAFAANHVQSGIDLLRVVRTQLRGRARISSNVSTPYGALLGASDEDGLLMRFIDATDQIAMHPANPIGNARVAALHARAAAKREISMLFARIQAPGAAGGAGQTGADQMERDLREAAERGADEISLYAYGLLREQDVAAFVAGVRRAFPL